MPEDDGDFGMASLKITDNTTSGHAAALENFTQRLNFTQLASLVADTPPSAPIIGDDDDSQASVYEGSDTTTKMNAAQTALATYELLQNILFFLPSADILRCQRVSTAWKEVSNSTAVRKARCIDPIELMDLDSFAD
ncbi:uncharacterized protein LTR77_010887 [Saxophila tyrrhenica]|uniref:F-box domain-containing protein n=1 Tax=Saxophila tyrrhenica TaxID=1690608 RepID=A0AAV9NXM7_9PEZI|nr:hypothetical protein LTR77_010887 [Saxophila tyrrhenica]